MTSKGSLNPQVFSRAMPIRLPINDSIYPKVPELGKNFSWILRENIKYMRN